MYMFVVIRLINQPGEVLQRKGLPTYQKRYLPGKGCRLSGRKPEEIRFATIKEIRLTDLMAEVAAVIRLTNQSEKIPAEIRLTCKDKAR
jgi:hypothetical protein